MARGNLWIALMVYALLLVGCSVTVIRPPSAGAFMEKSEDKFVKDVSFSLNLSDCWLDSIGCNQKSEKNVKKEEKEDWSYKREEFPFAFFLEFQKNYSYFKYGFGINNLTPFLQAGFVSDYFGVMGWSNLCLWQFEKVEHKYFQWGGGISLIEQLPIGDNFRIGLSQHLSRNGDAALASDGSGIAYTHSTPIFYDEIGFGGYISFIPYYENRVILEYQQGRDLTYKRYKRNYPNEDIVKDMNRYTISVGIQW